MESPHLIADKGLISNLPIGIYRNTPGVGGRFLSVNQAMVNLFGYDNTDELLQIDVSSLYVRPAERSTFARELMDQKRVDQKRLHLRRKDGTTFYARITARAIFDTDGDIRYFDGVLVPDFTVAEPVDWADEKAQLSSLRDTLQGEIDRLEREKMALEMRLAGLHRQASASILASGLAHEINNLNTTVLGLSQLTLADDALPPHMRDNVRRITDAVLRERVLTRGLLSFIRPAQQETLSGNLTRSVATSIDLLTHEFDHNGVTLLTELNPVTDTRIIEAEVGQIVFNLLLNALHAVSMSTQKSVFIRTWETECLVCVSVRDTGCGISPDYAERIFQPLVSTRKPHGEAPENTCGSGLGLSISQMLATRYGGALRVETLTDTGSKFTLELPRTPAQPAHHPAAGSERCPQLPPHAVSANADMQQQTPAFPTQNIRILVVDDEQDSCEMMRQALTRKDYPVTICSDPVAAVGILESESFDILICDLQMPKLCGKDFLLRASTHESPPKVIIVTGECPECAIPRLEGVHYEALLHKPFSLSELYDTINDICSGGSTPTTENDSK